MINIYYFIGNDDYDPGPYNVSIIAGTINVPFKITIVDDIVLERNEKFMLTIDAPSLPMSVSIDEVNQSIVTIVEDDGECIIMISLKTI